MALTLSDEMMKHMGFRPLAAGEVLKARFSQLAVFSIEGITVASAETVAIAVKNHACKLAIAQKINEACQALLPNGYTADELEWEKEHKCRGPYALVLIGDPEVHEVEAGQINQAADGSIIAYDCFGTARALLRKAGEDVLPELITALTCNFFAPDPPFRLRSVDAAFFGVTPEGITVHDLQITASGYGIFSIPASAETVQTGLAGVVAQAPKLNAKVARFFKLGTFEEDALKRFLYFFLALEVKTHATFGALDHRARLDSLLPTASLIGQSTGALLQRHTDNIRNLRDRFVWCAFCAWASVTEDDVTEFKRLKDIRDSIAHGSIDAPPWEAVRSIEALTIKVLRH